MHEMHPPPRSQFALLRQRRFAPFFFVQLLGAANDNLFKFAFTVLVAYGSLSAGLAPALIIQLIAILFILPFVLLSATSGQIADKFDKARLMRFVKTFEIAIAALGLYGFIGGSVPALLLGIFLLGVHSSLFGPVKYAYLPQHLGQQELTGGNGLVEMGTFVAILLGNVVGGWLVALPEVGPSVVAWGCMLLALLGRLAAQFVPVSPPSDPALRINWNAFSETWRNLRLAGADAIVFRALLGISWMWFFGVVFLTQFPSFARDVLEGDEHVASMLLVVFSVGIAIGALLCESLSRRSVEIGLVPWGALGMTIFALDLYLCTTGLTTAPRLRSLSEFFQADGTWRVVIDLFLLSMAAGIYSVPLYALVQARSPASHRSRIIAANNILNALFMIVSSGMSAALLSQGVSIAMLFAVTAVLNAVVTFAIFLSAPDYLRRAARLAMSIGGKTAPRP